MKKREVFNVGNEHIVIQRRYDALGTLNDLLIAIWFLTGSLFFYYDSLMTTGTSFFVAGSAQLLIKPAIKLASMIHVSRLQHKDQE